MPGLARQSLSATCHVRASLRSRTLKPTSTGLAAFRSTSLSYLHTSTLTSSPRPQDVHFLATPSCLLSPLGFQQSRYFRSMPMLSSSRNESNLPSSGDIEVADIPIPPNVELPPLPPGYARLHPDSAREIEKIFPSKNLPSFMAGIDEQVWLFVYVGAPEDLIESLESIAAGKVFGFGKLASLASLLEPTVAEKDSAYVSHPVHQDIVQNKRFREWKNLSTTQTLPLRYVPDGQEAQTPESGTNPKMETVEKSDQQSSESSSKEGQAVGTGKESKPKKTDSGPRPRQRRGKMESGSFFKDNRDKKDEGKKDDKESSKSSLTPELLAYPITFGILWAMTDVFTGSGGEREITWQELRRNFLDKGLVERLVVRGRTVRVDLNLDAVRSMYPESAAANPSFHYYFSIGSYDAFERKLETAQDELGIPSSDRIPVTYREEGSGFWGDMIVSWGSTLLFIGLLYWMSRSARGGGGGGLLNFSKSKAKRFSHETAVNIKFADVAGADEAKVEIMEFVSFLKSPERFQRLGAKIPRGAILSGPPGTGKTLLAKATAGESNVPFFSVSGSEFVEMFVGVGASRVRDLFSTARKNAPCIIFIDEIDAIGKKRSERGGFGGNDEREATLNQILTEMDGFNTQEQVVVLAGTNRPDMLDKALMRPGRFDRHINIDRPTMKGRADIFRVHLKHIVTKEDMDHLCGRLSALTPGFAGADIANAANEAALIAARANAETVEMTHFEQAIERVVAGLERKSLVLSKEEKRTVAYHEAGHAICGWYFEHADPLLKVSIIPRGQGALGYAQYLPSGDAYLMTVKQLMDRMAMTLGGRISEELHFDSVTTGASDDFKKVTQMATTMVTQWGMSEKLGPLHFSNDQQQFQKPFAESTAQTIDAEVRRIIDEAYKQCKDLLLSHKKEIGVIAEELLRKEVLTRDDLVRLLGPRKWHEKEEFSKYFDGELGGKHAPPPFPTEQTDSPNNIAPTAFKGQD